MTEKELDLSAFPLVRIDHLPLLPDHLLREGMSEIEEMISNEENGSKMYNYLTKQFNAMKVEDAQRQAQKRINEILSGTSDLSLSPSRYDNLFPSTSQSSISTDNKGNNDGSNRNKEDDHDSSYKHITTSTSSGKVPNHSNINDNSMINITPIKKKSRRLSASLADPIDSPSDKVPPRPPSPTLSIMSNPPSTNVTVRLANPSFGVEFVVSAVERKRRRPIQKKNEETPEQIKEKEKAQRRQEAIKRLMKRREEQAEAQQKLKEQQRLKKIKRMEMEKEEVENQKLSEKFKRNDEEGKSLSPKTISSKDIVTSSNSMRRASSFVPSDTPDSSTSTIFRSSSHTSIMISPRPNSQSHTPTSDNLLMGTSEDPDPITIDDNNFNNPDDHDDDLQDLDEDVETDNVISAIPIVVDQELIEAAKESIIEAEQKDNLDTIEDTHLGTNLTLEQYSLNTEEVEKKCSSVINSLILTKNLRKDSSNQSQLKPRNIQPSPSVTVRQESEPGALDGSTTVIKKTEDSPFETLPTNDISGEILHEDSTDILSTNGAGNTFEPSPLDLQETQAEIKPRCEEIPLQSSIQEEISKSPTPLISTETEPESNLDERSQILYISDSESLDQTLDQTKDVFSELIFTNETLINAPSLAQEDLSSFSLDSQETLEAQHSQNHNQDKNSLEKELSDKQKSTILTERPSRPVSMRSQKSQIASQQTSRPLTTINMNNTEKPLKLSDYYSNIRQIFTCSYINSTQTGAQPDSDYIARTLIESIQFQINLYEEWIDIMRDYSTVYCLNDGDYEDDSDAKEKSSHVYPGSPSSLHYSINSSSHNEVFNIVSDAFEERIHPQLLANTISTNSLKARWVPLPSGLGLGPSWNLLWTWSRPRGLLPQRLLIWQKTNHFQHSGQLTRKDLLKKNLEYLCGKNTNTIDLVNRKEFDIMPLTFLLPQEYSAFVQSFVASSRPSKDDNGEEKKEKNIWILKPIGLSRGRGISLVQSLDELKYSQASVIQKYVENPLCLNGYKFDLRLYVLVTCFHPLEAFIFADGFARVSTEKFSLSSSDISNKFIHLTNSSIQKHQKHEMMKDNPLNEDKKTTDFLHKEEEIESDVGGTKIGLLGKKGLWARLKELNPEMNIDDVWRNIKVLVLKSLVAVDEKIPYQPSSFELFGYDVLIDDDLKPWLIEVNASPSLARENLLDNKVKDACIRDIIKLINPAPYNRQELIRVLKKRLNDIRRQKINPKKKESSNLDQELEEDLRAILNHNNPTPESPPFIPRRYGETPSYLGGFEPLAPNTKEFDYVVKLKRKIYKPAEYDHNIATV